MFDQNPSLRNLIRQLQQVPYLASKNLYKVVGYFLSADQQRIDDFCKALCAAKENIVRCDICCCWKDTSVVCLYCDQAKRDTSIICVVETWHELLVIEKTEVYKGSYHVLGGALSPLDGIGPHDLAHKELIARIVAGGVREIILATNQTPEGEATASFIAQKLKQFPDITISCLARGVPVGSTLEYMDRVTVSKALSERRSF